MRGFNPGYSLTNAGGVSAQRDPSPGFAVAKPPSPTSAFAKASTDRRERVQRVRSANYFAIDTGEKSMNQLLGCTTPVTFGLIARGPTSWAT